MSGFGEVSNQVAVAEREEQLRQEGYEKGYKDALEDFIKEVGALFYDVTRCGYLDYWDIKAVYMDLKEMHDCV